MNLKKMAEKYILPYIAITIGTAAAAFALEEFLIPSTILDGGIMGISIILGQILKKGISLFVIALNMPFLIWGFKHLGWRFLLLGMEQAKAVMIITNEGRNIADELYKSLGRTCTLLEGEGLISGKKVVLYCVVTRIELAEVKRIVNEDDASAFVTVTDVSEIIGKHIKNTNVDVINERV